jgi:hypothetical protein
MAAEAETAAKEQAIVPLPEPSELVADQEQLDSGECCLFISAI